MSSDGTSDDVDKLVEPNIPAVPSKSFEFSCTKYSFMVVLPSHILVSHQNSML